MGWRVLRMPVGAHPERRHCDQSTSEPNGVRRRMPCIPILLPASYVIRRRGRAFRAQSERKQTGRSNIDGGRVATMASGLIAQRITRPRRPRRSALFPHWCGFAGPGHPESVLSAYGSSRSMHEVERSIRGRPRTIMRRRLLYGSYMHRRVRLRLVRHRPTRWQPRCNRRLPQGRPANPHPCGPANQSVSFDRSSGQMSGRRNHALERALMMKSTA